jgi:hypothetical protein
MFVLLHGKPCCEAGSVSLNGENEPSAFVLLRGKPLNPQVCKHVMRLSRPQRARDPLLVENLW